MNRYKLTVGGHLLTVWADSRTEAIQYAELVCGACVVVCLLVQA